MKILVTGAAGFIGHQLLKQLLTTPHKLVGIDSLNTYYDLRLKLGRLTDLGFQQQDFKAGKICTSTLSPRLKFIRMQLEDREALPRLFADEHFDLVVSLAAQAGVRYSLENPFSYIDSNVTGFVNLLECCRHHPVKQMLYASSSSVYGDSEHIPFNEEDPVNTPVSLYAATKRSNELLAYTYARLYGISLVGMRFFTVYGPWGRPDMAPMLFSKAILQGEPIRVFNRGDLSRDFTYIDDIVKGIRLLIDRTTAQDQPPMSELFNIGCGHPVALMDFIHMLESALGRKAVIELLPMQKGDVHRTFADTHKLEAVTGYKPEIELEEGIRRFAAWYLSKENPLR